MAITEEEVVEKLKEANGSPVRVQNIKTKKITTILTEEEDPTKARWCGYECVDIITDPSPKRPNGVRTGVPMKNLVFI